MPRRRKVLTGIGTGALGALAGCSECGETWYAHQLYFDVDEVDRSDTEWEITVTSTVDFEFPTSDDDGVGSFDVAVYGENQSLLDYETVDGLRWGDVPDDRRTETECGDGGTAAATKSFSLEEFPYYVGPRFVDGREAESLDPNSSSGFSALETIWYAADGEGSTTPTGTETVTETPKPTGEPPRDDVSPEDYERVEVEVLPWPTPDNQAVRETEALTNVRFWTGSACVSRSGVRTRTDLFDSDLLVEWARAVPGCKRPFLETVSYEDSRLTLEVGLHEAPQVRCRECDQLGYQLQVDRRAGREFRFEEVEIVHRSGDGAVVERVVELVDD